MAIVACRVGRGRLICRSLIYIYYILYLRLQVHLNQGNPKRDTRRGDWGGKRKEGREECVYE